MPQVTLPSGGTRLVNAQKPIAITTPQPHNSIVNTSRQSETCTVASSTRTTSNMHIGNRAVSSHSFLPGTNAQTFTSQNLPFSQPGFVVPRPGSGLGMVTSFSAAIDNAVERYVIHRPEETAHFQENTNTDSIRADTQLGFACPTCPKVFKSKAAMKLHMTVHKTSEERQFVCQVCERRFLHRHHLIVHQRKHSGEKPYSCNACSKSFMAVFLLHKHLRKHLREQGQTTEISNEQLKQLSGRKGFRTPASDSRCFEEGAHNRKPDLVIVSDDEDGTAPVRTETANKRCSEILEQNGRSGSEFRSDFAGKSPKPETKIDHIPKSDVKSEEPNSANVAITNIEIKSNSVKILTSSVKESDNNGVMTKLVIKEIEYDRTFNSERNNDSSDVKTTTNLNKFDHTFSSNIDDKTNIPENLKHLEKKIQEFSVNSIESDAQSKKTEFVDPWPKYTSDDETELDFLTGELRIVNRAGETIEPVNDKEISSKDSSVNKDSTETETVSIENNENNEASEEKHTEQMNIEQTGGETDNRKRSNIDNGSPDDQNASDIKHMKVENEVKSNVSSDIVPICERSLTSPPSKNKRNKGHKKIKRFRCETCSRTFYSQHHLLLHMNVHKKKPAMDSLKRAKVNQINVVLAQKSGFVCSVCNKAFKMKKGLNSHMRVHSSKLAENKRKSQVFRDFLKTEVLSKPKETDKNLTQTDTVIESQEESGIKGEISDVNNITCSTNNKSDSCDNSEQKDSCLNLSDAIIKDSFQVIIGQNNSKRYICHACNNTYTTKQKLKMHALIHKDNCYLCDTCGKSFFREATLEKHKLTHMLPRPHICTICKKTFIHRSSLMRHKSIHEKPSVPSVKQRPQDVKFELEMLDTYAMLRKERLEQLQKEKMDELKTSPGGNIMDLSVTKRDELTPVKVTDQLQPPKLSPMTAASLSVPSNVSVASLSPPNITKELGAVDHAEKEIKIEPDLPLMVNNDNVEPDNLVKRSRYAKSSLNFRVKQERQSSMEDESQVRTRRKRRKTRVYPTSCRICKEVFPNVMGLKTHMSVHNVVETHLYECNICGHRFTQSCSLLRHLKTSCAEGEVKVNKLQCSTCEKVFQRRNAYERHMDNHINGEPPKLNSAACIKLEDGVENNGIFKKDRIISPVPIEPKLEKEIDIPKINVVKIEIGIPEITVVKKETEIPEINNVKKEIETVNNQTDISELSEAETIPYGKTSSDESDDGFSDFSESTETDEEPPRPLSLPPQPPSHPPRPPSHPPNSSSLNLLSEVCSSLISLEKEAEMRKQSEMISVQKELETIDILARLSRQSQQMKSNIQTYSQGESGNNFSPQSIPQSSEQKVNEFTITSEATAFEGTGKGTKVPLPVPSTAVATAKGTTIPTVVMDMDSEAEKRNRSFFIRMQQRILEGTPRSYQGLTPAGQNNATLKANSLLAAALFDKGKPEPTPPHCYNLIHPSDAMPTDMTPTDLSMKKKTVEIMPVNHSQKSSSVLKNTLLSPPVSLSVPQPPPLVPVFKCSNCEKLLYNWIDYRHHMRGHGISPPDSTRQSPAPPQLGPLYSSTPPGPLYSSTPPGSARDLYERTQANLGVVDLTKDGEEVKGEGLNRPPDKRITVKPVLSDHFKQTKQSLNGKW